MKKETETETFTRRTREIRKELEALTPGCNWEGYSRADLVFWIKVYLKGVPGVDSISLSDR